MLLFEVKKSESDDHLNETKKKENKSKQTNRKYNDEPLPNLTL